MPATPSPLLDLYEAKGAGYFDCGRDELLPFIPRGAQRILDVGCASGLFGERLKRELQAECWGVEPAAKAAELARTRLDKVIHGFFSPDLQLPPASFDLICFNDVLEHIPEPVSTLQYARTLLRPGGRVFASLPNFRYITNIMRLLVKNEATYLDHGIMDRTHLRIFTKPSIPPFFAEGGFQVERIEGINSTESMFRFRMLEALTFGAIADMRWLQYVVVAKPTEG